MITAILLATTVLLQSGQIQPTITVQGEGTVEAKPDIFYLDVSIDLRDKELDPIRTEVSNRSRKVIAAANSFDLNKEHTFTREFKVLPQFDNARNFVGYAATQRFRLSLNDLGQAEALTTAVLKAGATTIELAEFSVKDAIPLWEAAREASVKDGWTKAKKMTAVLGTKPGKPLRIIDQGAKLIILGCAWNQGPNDKNSGAGGGLPSGDNVQFSPPTAVKFQANIHLEFSIEPNESEPKT